MLALLINDCQNLTRTTQVRYAFIIFLQVGLTDPPALDGPDRVHIT